MTTMTNYSDHTRASSGSDAFCPDFASSVGVSPGAIEEYGRFQQHLGLLEDSARVTSYLNALGRVPSGEVVVDVGAGTGIWAIAALKNGYEKAILIEPSRKICVYARHLAELNGVAERVSIINSTLEDAPSSSLPSSIDLVVTETLSSLLFGFGSWDGLPALARRLDDPSKIIPIRGRLYGSLAEQDFSSRGPNSAGLSALRSCGINIDLFERTFRSGGNVYDKETVIRAIRDKALLPKSVGQFDFLKEDPVELNEVAFCSKSAGATYRGIVLHWEVELNAGAAPEMMTSLDPSLTSWYPYYIPFINPVPLQRGELLNVKLHLLPIDYPYKYAIQLCSGSKALSRVLYW